MEKDLLDRAFRFGLKTVQLVDTIPLQVSGKVIARQLARAGTAIGANLEEAEAAISRREFIQLNNVAKREAREANYWLRILKESRLVKGQLLDDLLKESDELIRILYSIVKNSQSSNKKSLSLVKE